MSRLPEFDETKLTAAQKEVTTGLQRDRAAAFVDPLSFIARP